MKPITHIYLAGPFSDDPVANTARAVAAGVRLHRAGYVVLIPHVACQFAADADGYEAAMAQCMGWIERCDALVRLPGHSPGADREVERARALGLPVFYGVEAFP
jgi:nucleoside 2-deoxyribosyltransferase